MKQINKYLLQAKDDKEYDDYIDKILKDTFDLTVYINLLNSTSGKLLLDIINYNMEFFDRKNICIDFGEIKKTLKLTSRFAYIIDSEKPIDQDNIKINLNAMVLSKVEAENLCKQIHDEIFDGILKIKGTKITL